MWARLDDSSIDHPKVLGLGSVAFRLWISSIVYSARHLTDGRIDRAALAYLAGLVPASGAGLEPVVDELVEARLWDRVDDHFQVHDYLHYNPSKTDALKRRQQRAKAGRKGGKRSWKRRKQTLQVGAEADAEASASTTFEPRPVPLPSKEGGAAGAAPSGPGGPGGDTAGASPPVTPASDDREGRIALAKKLRAGLQSRQSDPGDDDVQGEQEEIQ